MSLAEEPKQASSKRKNKNYNGFEHYISRIIKRVDPSIGVTESGMAVLNSSVIDLLKRFTSSASQLSKDHKLHSVSSREVNAAVQLELPRDLSDLVNVVAERKMKSYEKLKV